MDTYKTNNIETIREYWKKHSTNYYAKNKDKINEKRRKKYAERYINIIDTKI